MAFSESVFELIMMEINVVDRGMKPSLRRDSRRLTYRAAFTMIELMVVVVISLTLGLVLLAVSTAASNAMETVNGQGTLQMQLALAEYSLVQDVRQAVGSPAPLGGTSLTLSIPSIDANGQIIAGVFDTVTYTRDATNALTRKLVLGAGSRRRAQAGQIIARDIIAATFSVATPPPAVRPQVTIALLASRTEKRGGRTYLLPLTIQAVLRNP